MTFLKETLRIFTPIVLMLAIFSVAAQTTTQESIFEIRADGLACPYCAYGIEKKLMAINGVKHVDINLKQGKVLVTGDEDLNFEEQQLKTLFNDSGFTYRTMKKVLHAKQDKK
ncbi:MAG: heavy-metal-associated domain-containing protein [Colwellia sp.]|nr:heavy-metal-associated domain-containing protein [Colwellia sp.]